MAGPAAAAPVAGVCVARAALLAGAASLMTPAGQRASQSLGEAMGDGGSQAVDNIRNLFSTRTETNAPAVPIAQDGTRSEERRCDGPHRGRLQVQGFRKPPDPIEIELSWPAFRPCYFPLKPKGLTALSADLLARTRLISYQSAGYRGPAFAKMSRHIKTAPPGGFGAGQMEGWGIDPDAGHAVKNTRAGHKAPRVDIEVFSLRAFGVR